MNTKTIIISLVVVVALVGLMMLGKNSQATLPTASEAANATSTLAASEVLYDFGSISMAKGKVTKVFKITNPTTEDVFVERLVTSCMCTKAYIINGENKKGPYGMPGHGVVPKANELIKAGESRDIEVVFDPAAHGPAGVGPIDRFIFLEDKKGGVLRLEIKAVVTP